METPLLARPRSFVAALGVLALAGALLAQPGSAAAGDQPALPVIAPSVDEAADAAARAVTVLDEAAETVTGPASSSAAVDEPARDLSLTLLDLARSRTSLPVARRGEADSLLARPTDGAADPQQFGYAADAAPTQACQDGFCVHWARNTDDAPALTDADLNGRPDSVDRIFGTLLQVGGTYAGAGYRAPVSDGTRGGGGADLFDVYLVNSGAQGVYGYCAPEDVSLPRRSAQSFCALDNDFAEFAAHTPAENMQVTVAHEYFHAVQFAYDITDDMWFLESTAAWIEDEMFDDVDDNVQYLRSSPISQPGLPIDKGKGLRVYGSWIFFRYLAEIEPKAKAGLPTVVRDIWRRAAGGTYSIQAIEAVLKARGRGLTSVVAKFAAANRTPAQRYAEGQRYPVATPVDVATVGTGRSVSGSLSLDHLASGTYRFKPGAGTAARSTKLRVAVDLPAKARPSAAVVTVRAKSGALRTRLVKVGRSGAGALAVPFSTRSVAHVEVTLVNASARYRCGRDTTYSCQGTPRDDNLPLTVRVRVTR
jgi:hypothetical protein